MRGWLCLLPIPTNGRSLFHAHLTPPSQQHRWRGQVGVELKWVGMGSRQSQGQVDGGGGGQKWIGDQKQ